MTGKMRSLFSGRPILLQVGAALILCQIMAHGLTIGFMFWRFERPDLLNATSVQTVQAIGMHEALLKATPAERPALERALSRAHPTVGVIAPVAGALSGAAGMGANGVFDGLLRARPDYAASALLLPGAANGGADDLIALPLPDGRLFAFVPETGDARITFPRIILAMFISMLVVPLAVMSLWVLKMLTAPLRGLAASADRFAIDLDPTPLRESGPAEIRKLAHAFNLMKGRIRQLVDSRSRMLAAVSHDLRTPLTRLRLRAEALPEGDDRDRMLRDIQTMNSMIGQALSYLRDQTTTAARERIDLPAMLEAICDDFSDSGQPATFAGPRNVVLDCEPELLTRAFSNLIDNAAKFGARAMVSLEVRSPSEVLIRIDDEGPGIPDAAKDLAFEPFSRGDAARGAPDTEGFGLGLAIARQIVERHGGRITLHDRLPCGLSVHVMLPLGRPAARAGAKAALSSPAHLSGAH